MKIITQKTFVNRRYFGSDGDNMLNITLVTYLFKYVISVINFEMPRSVAEKTFGWEIANKG